MSESPDSTISYQVKLPWMWRVPLSVAAACWLWLVCSLGVLAAEPKPKPAEFPVNPLEIKTPDPLLPRQPDDQRLLSPIERLRLGTALDELNRQAAARLQAGDRAGAFNIWNRELRLRRSLGLLAEIPALGRVGEVAWNENQQLQVQFITQRLQAIQQQAQSQPPVDLRVLRSLGVAYQQIRLPQPAVEVYQQILAAERQQQNPAAVEATLRTLAELHLAWFNYPPAVATYEELLSLARQRSDRANEVAYLQQLAYVYQQARQYQQAINAKQQLIEIYRNQQQFAQVPPLQLEIGINYQTLGQLKQAFQTYQTAYNSAWALQQYSRASDALRQLIALYRSQEQEDEALQTSQILLQSEQLAGNFYGMMTACDQIGQIHFRQGNYPEALKAFQTGLDLAQQLKYQEKYFAQQVSQTNQRLGN